MTRIKMLLLSSAAALALAGAFVPPASAADQATKPMTSHPRMHHAARGHAMPARSADSGDAAVERLNAESLQRAQQGVNAPGQGVDTTSNLNSMSARDASKNQNTGSQPMMPFK